MVVVVQQSFAIGGGNKGEGYGAESKLKGAFLMKPRIL